MSYLLDTCTWLRAVGRLDELNIDALGVLNNIDFRPFALSAISVWEVCTKFRKKPAELSITVPLDQWLNTALSPRFVRVIPVCAVIGRLSNELPGQFHEDPADRIVVATAQRDRFRILTSDHKIISYPHVQSLDTRK